MYTAIIGIAAKLLVILGAINLAFYGLLDFNTVAWIVGESTGLIRLFYILVGLSGLYVVFKGVKNSTTD